MKICKLQTLKSLWTLKPPCRTFHGHPRLLVSDVHSQYEPVRRGEQEIPKYFNFASDVLDKWSEIEKAGKRPTNSAFWWISGNGEEVKWSFEQLGFLSRKVANMLTKVCGLQKGDRVIVVLPRIPEWWLVNVACIRAGIVLSPGTSQLSAKDILYRLQASKAKCIITNDTLAPAVDSVASECQFLKNKLMVSKGSREGWLNFNELYENQPADHPCVKTSIQDSMIIFFTSGTTGSPKMTEHSQGSLGFRPLLCERYWLDVGPSDIVWGITDTGWIVTSVTSLFDAWALGSCVFVHQLPQIESSVILNVRKTYGGVFPIDTMISAPTLYRMLVQTDLSSYKFMNLKHCMSGGEPLNPEVIDQWKSKTGLDIHEIYGQTEAVGIICSVSKGMKIKPGSMGKAAPPFDVQVVDKNANILPPGQQGEIAIRSKPVRPLGLFTEYVVVKAFVVLSDAFSSSDRESLARDLQEHVKKTTAPYKYPRKVEFVQELPKTITGKIKRNELRAKEWGQM
uniref:medium-chain acyl-CoA ligase n=1 Tax=Pavo cristatus TaxID=9049 RepID=A0A8C9LG26_PAVCR